MAMKAAAADRLPSLRVIGAVLATLLICAGCAKTPPVPARSRLIVLGFDGMDPNLAEKWMADGSLPHFAQLARSGHYQRLATTNPPQSPVAWASFATGANPGAHGIFDFLRRDKSDYAPEFSIADSTPPQHVLHMFGWEIPLDSGSLRNLRDGMPFWSTAERDGDRATVLRVPVTYPPDPITRMLSGMGVPDLLGTQGTYTIYATRPIPGAENGGRVELVEIGSDGSIHTQFDGPANPLKPGAGALQVPLVLKPSAHGAQLTLADQTLALEPGKWSPWIHLRFRYAGFASIAGMVRAYLLEGFPRPLLYVSPINFDPSDPATPISSPPGYAAELARRIGDYYTLGMPEETWSLNQGHMSEQGWLDSVKSTLADGEKMLDDALARDDSELVVEVFVQTDRVSHMFWRGIDPKHPLYAQSSALARGAIPWIYRQADRVLGDVQGKMHAGDRLIVLSDHGFASFRRAVHLNRWLADQGYLVLKPGATVSAPLFAQVDWSKTRAYALGLNGIFINEKGREAQGVVATSAIAPLKAEIAAKLSGLHDGGIAVVDAVYDADAIYHGAHLGDAPDLVVGYAPGYRASWQTTLGGVPTALIEDNLQPWSGDHCIDPAAVPGVLFTSFQPDKPVAGIADVAQLILRHLPAPAKSTP
jgi:predicted AlkP superfamily phosphohydrolase/phosphomutase